MHLAAAAHDHPGGEDVGEGAVGFLDDEDLGLGLGPGEDAGVVGGDVEVAAGGDPLHLRGTGVDRAAAGEDVEEGLGAALGEGRRAVGLEEEEAGEELRAEAGGEEGGEARLHEADSGEEVQRVLRDEGVAAGDPGAGVSEELGHGGGRVRRETG